MSFKSTSRMINSRIVYSVEDHDSGKAHDDYTRYVTVKRSYVAEVSFTRSDNTQGLSESRNTMHLNVFLMCDGSVDVWKELWKGDLGFDPQKGGTKRPSRIIQDEAAKWVSEWATNNPVT